MTTLTEKQDAFARHKAEGFTHKAAVIAAGYSPAAAEVTATKLMQHEGVKKAIANYKRNNKNGTNSAAQPEEEGRKSYLKPRYDTPLALLEDLMNNPKAPDGVRIDAAKQALPYRHGKVAEAGKKEKAEHEAKKGAKQGKFKVKSGPGRPVATRMMN